MSVLRAERIVKSYRLGEVDVEVLKGVDLDIRAGEYVALMGPSGSGKSTLLNIIGLLDRPSAGVYRLNGADVTALSDQQQSQVRREKVGFVFQFFHLVPRLSAEENVELPLVLAGVPPSERAPVVTRLLEEVGIGGRAQHRPDQLSGGERQRVAIARAMVMQPAVILADEPTGNLDQATGKEVIHLLEVLNGKGMAVLLVTHDPELGGRARRQVRMTDGQIQSDTGARA